MNFLKQTLLAAVSVAVLAPAQADTLAVNYSYLGPTYDYSIAVVAPVGPGFPTLLTASPFLVANITAANSFFAFCLEPLQPLSGPAITSGDSTYTSAAFSNGAIQSLYDRYYSTALATPVSAAAFQFALWELAADAGANLSSGGFALAANAATTLGQQMLDGTAPQSLSSYTFVQWNSFGSQDMLQANVVAIPEASTYAMMLMGLVAFGAKLRRRQA